MINKQFGRWTVISFDKRQAGKPFWICRCLCGIERSVVQGNLITGTSKSCGCLGKENGLIQKTKHGLSYEPIYNVWRGMKDRCSSKNHASYKNYGGRGISICKEWKNDASVFLKWAMQNGYKKGLQLDRRNNDKDYCPENCRFIVSRKNVLNQRRIISSNKSGYRGVYKRKNCEKWISNIGINKKVIYLGQYDTKKEAVEARNNYIINEGLENDYELQTYK